MNRIVQPRLRGHRSERSQIEPFANSLENLRIGMTAPDIADRDLDGVEFKLSDYRGKVVVLDFWALHRIGDAVQIDAGGSATVALDFTKLPVPILGGSTWHFQFWYRDPDSGGTGSNASGGLEVTFEN